jgi:hypothetical protein
MAAAVIVAAANATVQRWRHRVDRLGAAVEQLCNEINNAADLTTDYWLREAAHQLKDPSTPLRGFRGANGRPSKPFAGADARVSSPRSMVFHTDT